MKSVKGRKPELAPVAELYPPQGEWTEELYFSLPEAHRIVELSEGRLVMPPHPTRTHQEVLKRLFLALNTFVESRGLGTVFLAPLPVRLWPGKIREPDIFFIAREHQDRIGERFCGVPDLVIEITSPSTLRTDRVEKFVEYARAGVQEYWIVDPAQRSVEVYILVEGAYVLHGHWKGEGEALSRLLSGFRVSLTGIFP